MTREEARSKGYCKHCAAWGHDRGCRCGVTDPGPKADCGLPADVIERWKGEHGLEGATKRSISSDAFGDADQQKKKRGRKTKRHLS